MSKQKIVIIFSVLIFSAFAFTPEIFSQEHISELLESAYQANSNGQNINAIHFFDKVLEIDPKNFDALLGKGAILIKELKHEESLDYLMQALEIDPDSLPVKTNLAITLTRLNQTEKAEQHLNDVLAIDENDIAALLNKATLNFVYKKDIAVGMNLLDKVLKIDPKNFDAIENKKKVLKAMPFHPLDGIIQTVLRDKDGILIGYAESNRIQLAEWYPKNLFTGYAETFSQEVTLDGEEFTIIYIHKEFVPLGERVPFRTGSGLEYTELNFLNGTVPAIAVHTRQHGMLETEGDLLTNTYHLVFPKHMLVE